MFVSKKKFKEVLKERDFLLENRDHYRDVWKITEDTSTRDREEARKNIRDLEMALATEKRILDKIRTAFSDEIIEGPTDTISAQEFFSSGRLLPIPKNEEKR